MLEKHKEAHRPLGVAGQHPKGCGWWEDLGSNAVGACKEKTRHLVSKGAVNSRPLDHRTKASKRRMKSCSSTTCMALGH